MENVVATAEDEKANAYASPLNPLAGPAPGVAYTVRLSGHRARSFRRPGVDEGCGNPGTIVCQNIKFSTVALAFRDSPIQEIVDPMEGHTEAGWGSCPSYLGLHTRSGCRRWANLSPMRTCMHPCFTECVVAPRPCAIRSERTPLGESYWPR